jgi:hypothetical protein
MLEVCAMFNMRIADYQVLPPGERALYNQFAILKLEEGIKTGAFRVALQGKGG